MIEVTEKGAILTVDGARGYFPKAFIISALEKQIAKKIEIWKGQCACPNCEKLFGSLSQLKKLMHWEMPYCKFCGQALDWSDE